CCDNGSNGNGNMKIDDLPDLGSGFLAKVPTPKTRMKRKFTNTGNLYHICKKYMSARPPLTPHTHSF
ncbi:hypothetical protein HHI36_010003, partial [Cryptolaemus montrouzieri]